MASAIVNGKRAVSRLPARICRCEVVADGDMNCFDSVTMRAMDLDRHRSHCRRYAILGMARA